MKPQLKPITSEMLRACFGPDAAIRKRLGWFRVTTRDGGEVQIRDSDIKPVRLSRRALAGCARLAGEAWGGGTVSGSADFKMALFAWAEHEGVNNMRVKERGGFAGIVVAALAAFIVLIALDVVGSSYGPIISGVVALLVWLLMKRAAKQEAQRETEQMSFPFPSAGGDAKEADDEDLKKGGWL
jgi:hypothetical protein